MVVECSVDRGQCVYYGLQSSLFDHRVHSARTTGDSFSYRVTRAVRRVIVLKIDGLLKQSSKLHL